MQSQKVVLLADLVANISHKVNTPLGVSVTTASYLVHLLTQMQTCISKNNIPKEEFLEILDDAFQASSLLECNLRRSVAVIDNLEQFSID